MFNTKTFTDYLSHISQGKIVSQLWNTFPAEILAQTYWNQFIKFMQDQVSLLLERMNSRQVKLKKLKQISRLLLTDAKKHGCETFVPSNITQWGARINKLNDMKENCFK